MLGVFRDAGYEVRRSFDAGEVHLEFDVRSTPLTESVMREREQRADARSIARLLYPTSVAVVGASSHEGKVGNAVETLGDYLREQRVSARLSLRQLAEQAGVSNPYLSQIERGLRRPSAEVLQQLAKALRISAEQLYIRAGIVAPDEGIGGSVELAVLGDPALSERQKQTLLDVYASFLALNSGLDTSERARPEAG